MLAQVALRDLDVEIVGTRCTQGLRHGSSQEILETVACV